MGEQIKMLLAGVRSGDFAALLALKDYCEEALSNDPGNLQVLIVSTHVSNMLNGLKADVTTPSWYPPCGIVENVRRHFRDGLMAISSLAGWKLGDWFDRESGRCPMNDICKTDRWGREDYTQGELMAWQQALIWPAVQWCGRVHGIDTSQYSHRYVHYQTHYPTFFVGRSQ